MSRENDEAFEAARAEIERVHKAGETELDLSPNGKFGDLTRSLLAIPKEIAQLERVVTLNLNFTHVRDLTPIARMTGLLRLFLGGTLVSDLAPIARMTGMQRLSIDGTQVSDLTPIARMTGMQVLSLADTPVSDLTPIAQMTGLQSLFLRNTQVSDLVPIARMTWMQTLSFNGTPVSDLAPIAGLSALAEIPEYDGLAFKDTTATRNDARLAEIAEIEGPRERALALSDYLGFGWRVPPDPDDEPAPDPLLSSILIDGKLELAPDPPSEAERAERLKRVIHERLLGHSSDLSRAAGNEFPRLAAKSRVLLALVDRPFEELELLPIHLEIDDLEARRKLGKEDGRDFSEDVLAALGDVTRQGPGLTLGHPDVDLFMERVRQARETPEPDAEAEAHARLSDAIIEDPAANGPRSIAMEQRAQEASDPATRQAIVGPKHKNLLLLLGREALTKAPQKLADGALKGIGAYVAGNLFGPAVTHFLTVHWHDLLAVAQTYGGVFANWFKSAMDGVIDHLHH